MNEQETVMEHTHRWAVEVVAFGGGQFSIPSCSAYPWDNIASIGPTDVFCIAVAGCTAKPDQRG